MDYKTYRHNTYESLSMFERTFKPWKKWQNVNLTQMCPCNTCEVRKELTDRQYEVQMSGGLLEEIMLQCEHCIDKLNWDFECFQKLAWYEEQDERLKVNE